MKQRTTSLLAVCLLAVACIQPVRADDPQLKQQLQSQLDRFALAVKQHDLHAVEEILPENFIFQHVDTLDHNRDEFVEGVKRAIDLAPDIQIEFNVKKIREKDGLVTAYVRAYTHATLVDLDGRHRDYFQSETVTFTWSSEGDQLRFRSGAEVDSVTRLDGKIVGRRSATEQGGSSQAGGPVSLKDLEGTTWVLVELGSGRSPLPESEITVQFADGRISGTAGINRYTGTVTATGVIGLKIGPLAMTEMAGPQPLMDQESEYLKRLQNVSQFSFTAGRLVLGYELEGNSDLLVYEKKEQ